MEKGGVCKGGRIKGIEEVKRKVEEIGKVREGGEECKKMGKVGGRLRRREGVGDKARSEVRGER